MCASVGERFHLMDIMLYDLEAHPLLCCLPLQAGHFCRQQLLLSCHLFLVTCNDAMLKFCQQSQT